MRVIGSRGVGRGSTYKMTDQVFDLPIPCSSRALTSIRYSCVLTFLCLLSLWITGCVAVQAPILTAPSTPKIEPGARVRPIQLIYRGEPSDLPSLTDGGLLILTLFKPSCSACGEISQVLSQIKLTLADHPLSVVGLCVEANGCVQIREFNEKYRPRYALTQLPPSASIRLDESMPFGEVSAVPTTYLIDSKGILIESFPGSLPPQYVITLLKRHSSEPLSSTPSDP